MFACISEYLMRSAPVENRRGQRFPRNEVKKSKTVSHHMRAEIASVPYHWLSLQSLICINFMMKLLSLENRKTLSLFSNH